ncbi:hypothetical protein N7925_30085 [Streptomyces sp. CA-278952]|uniref:hypothetical protein n=1 Tax=unclassified Streptomyces TaxID=2593676 RepID=UPI0022423081|nr:MULTISPECIES: hypothetical protein [unclassified Streptomyces]UZI32229.1 hypothetical protein OH133_31330 [Streptomyces sp. VB1]WDG32281.1 hypothetical protein N7925_30085 [Streptomyces sp. CA-278952]
MNRTPLFPATTTGIRPAPLPGAGPVPVPVPAAVRFRAACPDCRGRFELAAEALRLAVGATSRTTFYTFTCPECDASVRKPAGERIIELLTGGGVRTLRLHTAL